MTNQLHSLFQNIGSERVRRQRMTVKNALKQISDEEAQKLVDKENLRIQAIEVVEQKGIVFIDESTKLLLALNVHAKAILRMKGVQRDLLPLVEGCTVTTKYGSVRTDHILFIAWGAFHLTNLLT